MTRVELFRAGIWLAERLPASLLYGGALALGHIVGASSLPAQRRLARNLSVALGAAPTDSRLRVAVRHATAVHAANYVDLFRSRVITGQSVARRFSQAGPGWAALRSALDSGRGAVLVSAHFGRFELLSHYLAGLGFPILLPVEHLQPEALFQLVRQLREKPTIKLAAHDVALRPAVRALQHGEVVAFFADWDPSGSSVQVTLFDRQTYLPGGPAFVARRAGAPIIAGFCLPDERPGTFVLHLEEPIDVPRTGDADGDVHAATQRVAHVYERYIRARPDQWVMFHDLWPEGQ